MPYILHSQTRFPLVSVPSEGQRGVARFAGPFQRPRSPDFQVLRAVCTLRISAPLRIPPPPSFSLFFKEAAEEKHSPCSMGESGIEF